MSSSYGALAQYGRDANTIDSSDAPSLPTSPSGMRTPREIMRQRQAREDAKEARKRAESQGTADGPQKIRLEQAARPATDKRAAPSVITSVNRDSGYRSAGTGSAEKATFGSPHSAQDLYGSHGKASPKVPPGFRQSNEAQFQATSAQFGSAGQDTSSPYAQQEDAPSQQQPQSSARARAGSIANAAPTQISQRAGNVGSVIAPPAAAGSQPRSNVSSFPHAFERWEMLSSKWEGLTSHLIRRLEVNAEQLKQYPDAAELSRQVTDLSAAGANLFHAVVELQRLRASSERKFQRWFFETRTQQEKDQEEIIRLQNELDTQREVGATAAVHGTISKQMDELTDSYLALDRHNAEIRRELQISKEEARRAWEELGRREAEERERQNALREGHAIYIGGIQVQPMQNALSSRGNSQREAQYRTREQHGSAGHTDVNYGAYEQEQPSPSNTDPYSGMQPQDQMQQSPYRAYNPQYPQQQLQQQQRQLPQPPQLAGYAQQDPNQTHARSASDTEQTSPGAQLSQALTSRFYQQAETNIHEASQPALPQLGSHDRAYTGVSRSMQAHPQQSTRDSQQDPGDSNPIHLNFAGMPSGQQYPSGATSTTRFDHHSQTQLRQDDDEDEDDEIGEPRMVEHVARYGRVHGRSISGASNRSAGTVTSTSQGAPGLQSQTGSIGHVGAQQGSVQSRSPGGMGPQQQQQPQSSSPGGLPQQHSQQQQQQVQQSRTPRVIEPEAYTGSDYADDGTWEIQDHDQIDESHVQGQGQGLQGHNRFPSHNSRLSDVLEEDEGRRSAGQGLFGRLK